MLRYNTSLLISQNENKCYTEYHRNENGKWELNEMYFSNLIERT